MSKVLSLKQDDFKGSDGTMVTCWKVELDDKTNPIPCYSGEASKLVVGQPLPEGWSVEKSSKGKDYLKVPKKGGGFGGQSSWYNSEAGVKFTQERMDRRTALMQAVACLGSQEFAGGTFIQVMDSMYLWLRETSGAMPVAPVPVGGGGHAVGLSREDTPPPTSTPEVSGTEPVGEAGGSTPVAEGGEAATTNGVEGAVSLPKAHVHEWKDAPRDGWMMCAECGKAELASKVKT